MTYDASIVMVFVTALDLYRQLWCLICFSGAYLHTACARAYRECTAAENVMLQTLCNVTVQSEHAVSKIMDGNNVAQCHAWPTVDDPCLMIVAGAHASDNEVLPGASG
jgi:hypothetical protein